MPTKNLYCLVGKSGCGKTTIANELERRFGFRQLESYTTRPKRTPDERGHKFISSEEFSKLKGILAYTLFNGYEYCATQEQANESDVYIIDPDGVFTLKNNWDSLRDFVVIGINVPEEELRERMRARGDTEEMIESRVKNDSEKFKDFDKVCDIVIENRDLERTIGLLKKIIDALEA